ncbi:MAG: hypothetical protein ABIK28_14395 [Planctomycetota bacterium]
MKTTRSSGLVFLLICICQLILACTGKDQDAKRLFDFLPNDAVMVVSIPDFTKLKEGLLNSRLGKIVDDKEFAPIFKEIKVFYSNLIHEQMQEPELRQMLDSLGELNLHEEDLLDALRGELTFIVFNLGMTPSGQQALDFVLAAELNPKVAAILNAPAALLEVLGNDIFPTEKPFEKTETADGTLIHSLIIPELEMMQMKPSWVVLDNLFIFANHMESLQRLVSDLKAGAAPADPFSKSPAAKAVREALDGEPSLLVRLNKERLDPMLPLMFMPFADPDFIRAVTAADVKDLIWALGIDRNGLVRETCYCGGMTESSMVTHPVAHLDKVAPPNGSLAWFRAKPDLSKSLSEEYLSKIAELSVEEITEAFQEMEMETGISIKNDVIPAFEGTLAGYAAMPYNEKGHLAHFIPDAVLKAKVNDAAAAQRILDAIVKSTEGGTGFRPLVGTEYHGISIRRSNGRLDDVEPTLVLHEGWLYFSLYPQSVIRAMQDARQGPAPMTLAGEGLANFETNDTHFILTVDLVSVIQFLYNFADFGFHMDRSYPAVDFARMPTEDKLAKYLGPFAMVCDRTKDQCRITMVSPCGLVPGIALSMLVAYWYEGRYDDVRRGLRNEQDLQSQISPPMPDYPDWVALESKAYTRDNGTASIYAVGVAAADSDPAKRWEMAKSNACSHIQRIMETHMRSLMIAYAQKAEAFYDADSLKELISNEQVIQALAEPFSSEAITINKYLASEQEAYVLMRLDVTDMLFEVVRAKAKDAVSVSHKLKPGMNVEEAVKLMDEAASELKKNLYAAPRVPISGI